MKKSRLLSLKDMTHEDLALSDRIVEDLREQLPSRLLRALARADEEPHFYLSPKDHMLQSATRAYRAGRGDLWIVAALFHDLGTHIAPLNHAAYAAAVLRPYVTDEIHWAIEHHALFQEHYWAHLTESAEDPRERFRGHPHFDATVDFCHNFDQNCFDPDYDTLPLEFFAPLVHQVFGAERR